MRTRSLLLIALSLSLLACPADPEEPTPDAGTSADTGSPLPDASVTPDTGAQDAGQDLVAIGNEPGHNPLSEVAPAYPFPSDLYLSPSDATETGFELTPHADVLPRDVSTELFAGIDGFSLIPLILTAFAEELDTSTLPDPADELATLSDDSSVWLLEGPDWTRVPALAERDELATIDSRRALIVRPLRALTPDTDHVVVVRDTLRAVDGARLATPPAFNALMEETPTDSPEVESLRRTTPLVRAALEANGQPAEGVVVAWSFHTRSRASVNDDLLAMQRIAREAPLGEVTIDSDEVRGRGPDDAYVSRQLEARAQVPNFLDAEGRLIRGEDGLPRAEGTREMVFTVTIPNTVTSPRPAIVFGHGFFSDRTEATATSFNDLCYEKGFTALATDYLGFNEDEQSETVALLTSNFNEIDRLIWRQYQAYTHFTALQRLAAGPLAQELRASPESGLAIDPQQVHYMGISNGATFGAVVAASAGVFARAALVVGAGGIVHFLQRATQWNELGGVFELRYRDPYDLQLLMSIAQHKLDPIDSMSWAHLMGEGRPAELGDLSVSYHMATHDSQVANLVTRAFARSVPLELVTPSPDPAAGLKPLPEGDPGETSRALTVYTKEEWTPGPLTNVPPAEDNRAHSQIRNGQAYRTHIARFIETGEIIMTCEGTCDPE